MSALPYAPDDRRDGVVGLAFAIKQVAQLFLMCDRHDIGLSIDTSDERRPQVFVYDNYPGGIGFSQPLYRMHDEVVRATRALIADCACESGCPGCVGPVGDTGPLAKAAALRILDLMLDPSAPAAAAVTAGTGGV
jgi:DEAD/DEAH box helicase domain-containing protein